MSLNTTQIHTVCGLLCGLCVCVCVCVCVRVCVFPASHIALSSAVFKVNLSGQTYGGFTLNVSSASRTDPDLIQP